MSTENKPPTGAYTFAAPTEIPEPWATAMKASGNVNPQTGEPSIQALYRSSGVHASAISRLFAGRTKTPRGETILKLSEALDLPFIEVAKWVGSTYTAYLPWEPPENANLMTPANRAAVETIINQLVKTQTEDDYKEWNKTDGKTQP